NVQAVPGVRRVGPQGRESSAFDPLTLTRQRQRERERRTGPDLALDPDPPAVKLDEFPAERQAESGSLSPLVRVTRLPELFEHSLLIFRSDSDPAIRHGDLDHFVDEVSAHIDPTTLRRELRGIREQVEQDLF